VLEKKNCMNLISVNLELDPEKKYDIFFRLRGKIFNYCERLKNSEAKLNFFKTFWRWQLSSYEHSFKIRPSLAG
jgi:hypothetical protein